MGVQSLTPREEVVLSLIAEGKTTKEIAFQLGIAFKTAACHRNHLLAKLRVANTAELVWRSLLEGLIKLPAPPANSIDPGKLATIERLRRVQEEHKKERQILASQLSESRRLRGRAEKSRRELVETSEQLYRAVGLLFQSARQAGVPDEATTS